MLLSLIIKHSTQILFPSGKLIRLIEPVLSKHRQNIKFYNRTHPLISAAGFLSSAEIAMADLESASKRFIICYLFIQYLDLVNQRIEGFVRKIYAATAKASEGGKNVYCFLLSGKDTKEGAMEEKSIDEVLKGGYTEILGVNAYTGGYSWAILKDGEFYDVSVSALERKAEPNEDRKPFEYVGRGYGVSINKGMQKSLDDTMNDAEEAFKKIENDPEMKKKIQKEAEKVKKQYGL